MKYRPLKLKSRYVVQPSRYPNDDGTHIVLYESETLNGVGYKRVFKGSYKECQNFKKERENVLKSERTGFKLFRRTRNNK